MCAKRKQKLGKYLTKFMACFWQLSAFHNQADCFGKLIGPLKSSLVTVKTYGLHILQGLLPAFVACVLLL